MKKLFPVFALTILLIFVACGCSGSKNEDKIVMSVSTGIYKYYNDKTKDEKKADSAVCEMAAAEALMKKNKLTLNLELKNQIAQTTKNEWLLFGKYYASINVSKPDITAVQTYNAQKQALLQFYFGANGKNAVSDDDLKEEFVRLYAGYKGFEVPLTVENAKGETVEMTAKEKEKTETELRELAKSVDSGKISIDTANKRWAKKQNLIVTGELETALVSENDPMYDSDFYKKLCTISHGRAAIIKSGGSIYVVERQTIATNDEDAFAAYRNEVLEKMKMPAIEKKIEAQAQKYAVKHNKKEIEVIEASVKN